MHDNGFSPRGIQFSQSPAAPAVAPAFFGAAHRELQARRAGLPPARWPATDRELQRLESDFRRQWLSAAETELRRQLSALVEMLETQQQPAACQALQTELRTELARLRERLQAEALPLLQQAFLQPLLRFLTAQLNRLDALQLNNRPAFDKSAEVAESLRRQLLDVPVDVEELLELIALDRLLDTAVRYLFAWDVAAKASGEAAHQLTALQQIARQGLRPQAVAVAEAVAGQTWVWIGELLCNDLGVPLRSLKGSYKIWLRHGLYALQQAVTQAFAPQLLDQALEAFYCAHSLDRERPEALVAIAWMLTLLQQPVAAVDCLELALRLDPMPEIKALFWQIQALDPANRPARRLKSPVANS